MRRSNRQKLKHIDELDLKYCKQFYNWRRGECHNIKKRLSRRRRHLSKLELNNYQD